MPMTARDSASDANSPTRKSMKRNAETEASAIWFINRISATARLESRSRTAVRSWLTTAALPRLERRATTDCPANWGTCRSDHQKAGSAALLLGRSLTSPTTPTIRNQSFSAG